MTSSHRPSGAAASPPPRPLPTYPPTRPKGPVPAPELKKPLKRLAARFFQVSVPLVGREPLPCGDSSGPGMLASPRNSVMFFLRLPGACAGTAGGVPRASPRHGTSPRGPRPGPALLLAWLRPCHWDGPGVGMVAGQRPQRNAPQQRGQPCVQTAPCPRQAPAPGSPHPCRAGARRAVPSVGHQPALPAPALTCVPASRLPEGPHGRSWPQQSGAPRLSASRGGREPRAPRRPPRRAALNLNCEVGQALAGLLRTKGGGASTENLISLLAR